MKTNNMKIKNYNIEQKVRINIYKMKSQTKQK